MAIVTRKPAKKEITKKVPKAEDAVATKRCPKCEQDKPATKDHFPPRSDRNTLHTYCRPCKSAYESEKRAWAAVRKVIRPAQKSSLGAKFPMKLWSEEADSLWVDKKGVLSMDSTDFEIKMELTPEMKRKLVIALGGVWPE